MSLVSVIVPIYNIQNYIDKCIQSIRSQSYQELEIILVDDGSPDDCGRICDRYAAEDDRIRVIHKANGGLSDARNVGAAGAKGDYLLFVDGDDYIAKNLVESTVLCAENQEADLVIFDFAEVEEDTGRTDRWSMELPRNCCLNLKDNPGLLLSAPCAWNKLYRAAFWKQTNIQYPVGRNYEDLSTTPKLLLQAERMVYLDSPPLYYYVLREGSIMRSYQFDQSFGQRTAALEDILGYYKEQGKYEDYEKELEYLTFLHGYFIPSKEIVLANVGSEYLDRFRAYTFGKFPKAMENGYMKEDLSKKDRLLLLLLRMKWYGAMRTLSNLRKQRDKRKK